MLSYVLGALVLLITCTVEGITGFGGGILALPFLDKLVGLKVAVPALAILGLLSGCYRTVTLYKFINRRELGVMLLFIILGLPVGMWAFTALPEKPLKLLLGVFMIYVAVKGLLEVYNPHLKAQAKQTASGWRRNVFYALLFCGGIMQGAFTSGGPFVVMYAAMAIKEKDEFRGTLFAMWVVVNTLITGRNAISGVLTREVGQMLALAVPAMILAIIISNILQKRVNGRTFNIVVYGTLLLSGVLMGINQL